jgi:hypothetical protein
MMPDEPVSRETQIAELEARLAALKTVTAPEQPAAGDVVDGIDHVVEDISHPLDVAVDAVVDAVVDAAVHVVDDDDDQVVSVMLHNGHGPSGGTGPGVVTVPRSEVAGLIAAGYATIVASS